MERRSAETLQGQDVKMGQEQCGGLKRRAYAPEGEVDQRRDKTGEAAGDSAVGMDFDISAFICVF